MKIGIALGMLHPTAFEPVALEADRLGFEAIWFPEHSIFPVEMSGSPFPGACLPGNEHSLELVESSKFLQVQSTGVVGSHLHCPCAEGRGQEILYLRIPRSSWGWRESPAMGHIRQVSR